jgi:hypothetical protein
MDETCAVHQSVGTTPVYKDLLKMRHNIDEMMQVLLKLLVLVHLDLLLLMDQSLIVIL